MSDTSIQHVVPSGVPVAANYQSFEMAKANDDVLGSDNIAQIRSYAAYARAQAQAIHKTIAATSGIDDVAAIKAEATETAQTFAKVGLYADQRIGEILRELPTGHGNRFSDTQETLKADAIKESGISKSQAYDLQTMAANPEIVEAVIAKAEAEGRIVSRKQVLDAISAQKRAEQERDVLKAQRDAAIKSFEEVAQGSELLETEAQSLRRQLAERPKPEVIEREVEVVREVVPEDVQRRMRSLKSENERLNREYQEMWRKKRESDEMLAQANELLGEKGKADNATRDIEQLTIATNNYISHYGGKAWAFDQFYRVDEATRLEFKRAIGNILAFAQNMWALVDEKEGITDGE